MMQEAREVFVGTIFSGIIFLNAEDEDEDGDGDGGYNALAASIRHGDLAL